MILKEGDRSKKQPHCFYYPSKEMISEARSVFWTSPGRRVEALPSSPARAAGGNQK